MKTITERALEIAREHFFRSVGLEQIAQALDEWQATVEERLASLCEARAKECPHYEFMGGCWKETGKRACGLSCNCDCHRPMGARSENSEGSPTNPTNTTAADAFSRAATEQSRAAARLIDQAVRSWAEAAGVTPEELLKSCRPVLRQEIDKDMSMRTIVEAKPVEVYEARRPCGCPAQYPCDCSGRYEPDPELEVE